MASPGQEQSQHEMKDQMMQMRQELNDEKTAHAKELNDDKSAHSKVKYQLLYCIAQLKATEACMKRVEVASLEKIKSLHQLISHNQNVERVVALNQQCLVEQKAVQATEMKDWKQRTVVLATNCDKLEILALRIQNKLLVAQINQLRKEKGEKMSKTQKKEGEVQVQKLEEHVGDVQTQLNHEKRELTAKISHCNLFLEDSHCSQELEQKVAECKTTELAAMNEAEKQLIMTQILSVQTELKKSIDVSHQQTDRNEELQKELKPESEQQSSNELETNTSEAMSTKLQMYSIKSIEDARQSTSNEIGTLATRFQEFKEANNDLETSLAGVKTETTKSINGWIGFLQNELVMSFFAMKSRKSPIQPTEPPSP